MQEHSKKRTIHLSNLCEVCVAWQQRRRVNKNPDVMQITSVTSKLPVGSFLDYIRFRL